MWWLLLVACFSKPAPVPVLELVWKAPAACPEGESVVRARLKRAGLDGVIALGSGTELRLMADAASAERTSELRQIVAEVGGLELWTVDEAQSDPHGSPSGPFPLGELHAGRWVLDGDVRLLLVDKAIGSEHLADVALETDDYGTHQRWTLTEAGKARFAEVTAANVGKRIVALDGAGRVLMAPVVQEAITGGVLTVVSGAGQETKALPFVERLGCGYVLAEERVIGPSQPAP